jgi:hypothetical protein
MSGHHINEVKSLCRLCAGRDVSPLTRRGEAGRDDTRLPYAAGRPPVRPDATPRRGHCLERRDALQLVGHAPEWFAFGGVAQGSALRPNVRLHCGLGEVVIQSLPTGRPEGGRGALRTTGNRAASEGDGPGDQRGNSSKPSDHANVGASRTGQRAWRTGGGVKYEPPAIEGRVKVTGSGDLRHPREEQTHRRAVTPIDAPRCCQATGLKRRQLGVRRFAALVGAGVQAPIPQHEALSHQLDFDADFRDARTVRLGGRAAPRPTGRATR